ncbi:hypothetical protein O181_045730 [Austropuccinia psidii MF-1]|uniref:AGC/AKT protein kinase n=1 Tax=Austropuccinia psidii MF-1 TaxID=1389203 RepID=A0A9Q3DRZ0_9BASI|nr:hypothetical protein [Austropuccinia psidii MF-1]
MLGSSARIHSTPDDSIFSASTDTTPVTSVNLKNLSAPSAPPKSWPDPSQQPDHQLSITLIGAKSLKFKHSHLTSSANQFRPYAVLQFDQTESVTQEAGSITSNSSSPNWKLRSSRPTTPRLNSFDSTSSSSTICKLNKNQASTLENPVWNHTAIFDVFKPQSSIFISIYHHYFTNPNQDQHQGFLGGAIIDLNYNDQLKSFFLESRNNTNQPSLSKVIFDGSINLWDQDGVKLNGEILIKIEIKQIDLAKRRKKIETSDFEVVKLIGEGSYGQVFRVRKKDTRRLYAMKVLDKQRILGDGKAALEHVLAERQILEKTWGCGFLVGLKFSFQSETSLYLVMDLKTGGELMSYMQRFGGRFQESWAVFYTAEILSGLSFLHSMDIVYRDLKPENCLLDATGHVALCDFGLSKLGMAADTITKTFCGTTEYIAPEILLEQGYTRTVDFWSLGVLIFEMSVGWTPFFSEDRVTKYTLILECDISAKFPKRGVSEVTKNVILRLLERDRHQRLGANGIQDIERHEFFGKMDWKALVGKRLTPPFKPRVESDANLSHCERVYYHGGGNGKDGLVKNGGLHSRRSSVEHKGLERTLTTTAHAEKDDFHQLSNSHPNEHSEVDKMPKEKGQRNDRFRGFTFSREEQSIESLKQIDKDFIQQLSFRRSSETRYPI